MQKKRGKGKWSPQLFAQLGGSLWTLRKDIQSLAHTSHTDAKASSSEQEMTLTEAGTHSEKLSKVNKSLSARSAHKEVSPLESKQHVTGDVVSHTTAEVSALAESSEKEQAISQMPHSNVVLIGAELNAVWQNEESLAWRLWQNIMKVFHWQEQSMVFFDTTQLVSEPTCEATIEEIIDLNVDWVLSMDPEHDFSQQVAEGVQVISIPDFETLLSDPYAKQALYQTMMSQAN